MAVLNPSVKCRSFPGRKAYDVLLAYTNRVEKAVTARSKQFRICCTARIPCQGDPVLISYQAHKLALENNTRSELRQVATNMLEAQGPEPRELWELLKKLLKQSSQQEDDDVLMLEPSHWQSFYCSRHTPPKRNHQPCLARFRKPCPGCSRSRSRACDVAASVDQAALEQEELLEQSCTANRSQRCPELSQQKAFMSSSRR